MQARGDANSIRSIPEGDAVDGEFNGSLRDLSTRIELPPPSYHAHREPHLTVSYLAVLARLI